MANAARAKERWATEPGYRDRGKISQRNYRVSLNSQPEKKAVRLKSKSESSKRARQTPGFRTWLAEYKVSEAGERRRLKNLAFQAAKYRTPEGRAAAAAIRHQRRAAGGPPPDKESMRRLYATRICFYCGVGMDPSVGRYDPLKTTIDHKIPLVRGGTNASENLVACCFGCNTQKNARTAGEFLAYIAKVGLR